MEEKIKRCYTPRTKKTKQKNINERKRQRSRTLIPMTSSWKKPYWIDMDGNVFNVFGKK